MVDFIAFLFVVLIAAFFLVPMAIAAIALVGIPVAFVMSLIARVCGVK